MGETLRDRDELARVITRSRHARKISRTVPFIPFAVIGSDSAMSVGGKRVLGRQTKWGFVEVDNKRHCEFSQLRDMLIK